MTIEHLDRPCERWSLQETHEAHKFSHADGWANCPGCGRNYQLNNNGSIRHHACAARTRHTA